MKKFTLITLTLLPVAIFAEFEPLPDSSVIGAIVDFIKNISGAGMAAIVASVVQLAMIFFRTPMGASIAGIWQLATLYGLSAVLYTVQALIAGHSVVEALLSGAVAGALMNGANEVIKHLQEKKA